SVILLVSLIGNSCTLRVIARCSAMRRGYHFFLFNMAVTDLLVTIGYMPRMVARVFKGSAWLIHGTPGLISCRLIAFIHHLSILVSVFCVLGIAVDRFCAILFPFRRVIGTRVIKVSIGLMWLLAIIVRSP
ncbi:predicted protein, partial [Nematostella vectensis]